MISIRIHGQSSHKYDNARIGINGRIDAIQAAILLAKLDIFPEETELRQQVAQRYTDGITSHLSEESQKQASLITPFVPDGQKGVWAQYSLLAKDRRTRASLQANWSSGTPHRYLLPETPASPACF